MKCKDLFELIKLLKSVKISPSNFTTTNPTDIQKYVKNSKVTLQKNKELLGSITMHMFRILQSTERDGNKFLVVRLLPRNDIVDVFTVSQIVYEYLTDIRQTLTALLYTLPRNLTRDTDVALDRSYDTLFCEYAKCSSLNEELKEWLANH